MRNKRTILSVLQDARALLAKRKNWCQSDIARSGNSQWCDPYDSHACQWCLVGAIEKCLGFENGSYPMRKGTKFGHRVYQALEKALGSGCLVSWNDSTRTKHKDVLTLLDTAIKAQP